MSPSGNQSHNPETGPDGIRPEVIGRSTYDDDWKPGEHDPYTEAVKELSDPLRPGIAPSPQMVDIGGIHVTREQAILLGIIDE